MSSPSKVVIFAKQIFCQYQKIVYNSFIIIENGVITSITNEEQQVVHFSCHFACPGFVDIHNHGVGGADNVEEYWFSDYTLQQLPKHGTTSVLASLTFSKENQELTRQVIVSINKRCGNVPVGQCRLAGIHAEGPIIQTCGGLPASETSMTVDAFEGWVKEMLPALKIMTISPSMEQPVNYERLHVLLKHKVRPAIGHDLDANEESILGCLQVASQYKMQLHMTHLFNVSQFHHRKVSLCNFGLVTKFPKLPAYQGIQVPTVEVIGDFVHVHPLTLQMAMDSKGQDMALITDAIMQLGESKCAAYGSRLLEIKQVEQKPCVVLHGTNTIAGSCANQLQIFDYMRNYLQVPLDLIIKMLSETPAKIAQLDQHIGTLQEGKFADILLFDSEWQLQQTLVHGHVAFSK